MSPREPSRPPPSSPTASKVMRANPPAGTRPEARLRSALHQRGLRFRKDLLLHAGGLRARPDIVFTRRRVAVFVDGCFWHRCPEHATTPRSNSAYWTSKFAANIDRDRRLTAALKAEGWTVLRIWEHVDVDTAIELVERALAAAPAPSTR